MIPYPTLLGLDAEGREVRLSNFPAKVILYFYPKDNTSGCTAEACSMRDNMPALTAEGYQVIGVSVDSGRVAPGKFAAKHQLDFPLVADTEHSLVEQMGVWGENRCMAANTWYFPHYIYNRRHRR